MYITNKLSVCLAILNYNGIEHLQYILPTALEAQSNFGANCRVIVLDNKSTDNDCYWLKQNYPQIDVLIAPGNQYLYSYNWLCQQIDDEIVIFLNNDLKLVPDFICWMLQYFQDDRVFAVAGQLLDWNGEVVTSGPWKLKQRRGWYDFSADISKQETSYTLFANGGFMAVDRQKFNTLGGFDELFAPAYCEDANLGYRAWAAGWCSIYEPRAKAMHRESGTISHKAYRWNQERLFLFHWRNLRNRTFFTYHTIYMIWLNIRMRIVGNREWLSEYTNARKIWNAHKSSALKRKSKSIQLSLLLEHLSQPLRLD